MQITLETKSLAVLETAALVTYVFENGDASLGRAEALRRAMLSVMSDTSRPAHWVPASHPSVWAPFVVVGEGGAGV